MKEALARKSIALALTFLSVVAMVAASSASANQGGLATSYATVDGTHSYLTRNQISSVSGGAGALFVRTQNSASTALIQVGYHRSLLSGDDCALDGGAVNIFVEWKSASSNYNCTTYYSGNTGDRFGVVQQGSTTYWGAYQNGTLLTPTHNVGYSTGYALVGGEWNGYFPYVSGCYGCGGTTPWEFTQNNGATYTLITMAPPFNDGGWTTGSAPSPFTIKNY